MNEGTQGVGSNTMRSRYAEFRSLLSLHNDSLEILTRIQENLRYIPAGAEVPGERAALVFDKVADVVRALEKLTGRGYRQLTAAVAAQRKEMDAWLRRQAEEPSPPFFLELAGIDRFSEPLVGGKAAMLGEVRNRLGLPVPDGSVLTAAAYRRVFGSFLWRQVRDLTRRIDLEDLRRLEAASALLVEAVQKCPIPGVVEAAITERARRLAASGCGIAVRSSAVGEGGRRTFAGQFRTFLNTPPQHAVEAWRRVIASRFSATAISYRLSAGIPDVEGPMAVLFLPMLCARASGIVYTRDPGAPKSDTLWIMATAGLPPENDSSGTAAELLVVSHSEPHALLETRIVPSIEQVALHLDPAAGGRPAGGGSHLSPDQVRQLASWACLIENRFGSPQDIEWVLDEDGKLWIVQTRPLVLTRPGTRALPPQVHAEPILSGGTGVYPGRVSGVAWLAQDMNSLGSTPAGAVLFLRKASPEIAEVLPRISGLVAEWGNLTGHAAALLREFRIPSVFQMAGAFAAVHPGDPVSLDAVQPRVYAGAFWPGFRAELPRTRGADTGEESPVDSRLLRLHLVDSSAIGFRAGACRSAHDVLRYCHETAIQTMFALNDGRLGKDREAAVRLVTSAPLDVRVLDLGGGIAAGAAVHQGVRPEDIVSRPFRSLWRGMTGPAAECRCDQPIGLADLASLMHSSFEGLADTGRALGQSGSLILASEYLNLNSRLSYHFALMDACVTDRARDNSISFRFVGGGASRERRDLRALFLESCLLHYGFQVRCRGDLVDAWYRKAPAAEMERRLEMLGGLISWASRLDMYMSSYQVMDWYTRRFLERDLTAAAPGLVCESCSAADCHADSTEVSA